MITGDREYLGKMCTTMQLSVVYQWQAISIYSRIIKPERETSPIPPSILFTCMDLAIRWLGPQSAIEKVASTPDDLETAYKYLFPSDAPPPRDSLRRELHWRIFIELLQGRI